MLIVQSQALLDADHPSTLIVPLTTHLVEGAEPLRLRVPAAGDLRQESDLLLDQLRASDNRRLRHSSLLRLSPICMARVNHALREVLDMLEA